MKLKFRAWNKHEKRWKKNLCLYLDDSKLADDLENEKDYIIEQFIGLKDINNTDIYEGDIVRYIQPEIVLMDYPNGKGNEAEIKFLNEGNTFGFYVLHKTYCWSLCETFCKKSLAVVGNIHEGILL